MLSESSRRLADDHDALNKLLGQLKDALDRSDVAVSHAKLDLFWAKLAVHIRAEHLHLFPAILENSNGGSMTSPIQKPSAVEARWAIGRLRADHEFMMHELARLIESMRKLSGSQGSVAQELAAIRSVIVELEKRLVIHNEFEETQIYRWTASVLDSPAQAELARQIDEELTNRPSRFPLEVWANE